MAKAAVVLRRGKRFIVHNAEKALGGKRLKSGKFAMPYTVKGIQRLHKRGVNVRSTPADYRYPGHYKHPRPAQVKMLDFHLSHERAFNFSQVRTGKTAPAIWDMDIRMKHDGLRRILIITPLSTILDTWEPELTGIVMHLPVYYAIKSGKHLRDALESNKYPIVVLNPAKFSGNLDAILKWNPQRVYVDECTEFKDPKSGQGKALVKLLTGKRGESRGLLLMSGTPVPQRPTDFWNVGRLVNPDVPKFFSRFRDLVMYQPNRGACPHLWKNRDGHEEIVASYMTPSIRFLTKDVADMPEQTTRRVRVEMGKAQKRMFEEMRADFMAEDDGRVVTADNAAVKLFKLLQIANGSVYAELDEPPMHCGAPYKFKKIAELVQETPRKSVIMCGFTVHQKQLVDYLGKKGYNVGLINGKIKGRARQQLINDFQNGDIDILVCHPKTTRFGLKLHAASLLIWFGALTSSENYIQASARIMGPGTGETEVVELCCTTLEEERFEILHGMNDSQINICDFYRKVLHGDL